MPDLPLFLPWETYLPCALCGAEYTRDMHPAFIEQEGRKVRYCFSMERDSCFEAAPR